MRTQRVNELNQQIDELVLGILGPACISKQVPQEPLQKLHAILDELAQLLETEDLVPKSLPGRLMFIFSSLLAEAEHAANPEPLLNDAWAIQDKFTRVFGPRF